MSVNIFRIFLLHLRDNSPRPVVREIAIDVY